MRRVIIESPYAGNKQANILYAMDAMKDCLMRGEAPLASHLLYTQVLDDDVQAERSLGMDAGWAWMCQADAVVVYSDLGLSSGMQAGIDRAKAKGIPIEVRKLPKWDGLHTLPTGKTDPVDDLQPSTPPSAAEIPFRGEVT